MDNRVFYVQPQPNYTQPSRSAQSLNTRQKTHTENVSAKPGSKTVTSNILTSVVFIGFGMMLCGIPLAVVSVLYGQARATASNTTNTTTNTSVTLPSQCTTYTTNTDSTRNIASGSGALGDNTLTTGWYRFMSPAGTQITTTTVSRDTCTTYYGGSFNGTMPSTAGTTTYGTMCFNNNGQLCYASYSGTLIGVTNCNGYYVYYLTPLPQANSRYCTT